MERVAARRIRRYRWMTDAPVRDGADALRADRLEIETARPDGKAASRNGFGTGLAVAHDAIVDLAACGRARWKVENETFDILFAPVTPAAASRRIRSAPNRSGRGRRP